MRAAMASVHMDVNARARVAGPGRPPSVRTTLATWHNASFVNLWEDQVRWLRAKGQGARPCLMCTLVCSAVRPTPSPQHHAWFQFFNKHLLLTWEQARSSTSVEPLWMAGNPLKHRGGIETKPKPLSVSFHYLHNPRSLCCCPASRVAPVTPTTPLLSHNSKRKGLHSVL